jgi:hypothetical protein
VKKAAALIAAFAIGAATGALVVGRYQVAPGPAGTVYQVRFDRWTGRTEFVRPAFAQQP